MLAINKNLGKYAHEVLIVSSLLQEAVKHRQSLVVLSLLLTGFRIGVLVAAKKQMDVTPNVWGGGRKYCCTLHTQR